MNRVEACEWVHTHLITDEMVFDELVAAFTALAGRVPESADRPNGLFRRCCEIVTSLPHVDRRSSGTVSGRRYKSPAV